MGDTDLTDAAVDSLLPDSLRVRTRMFWTPVAVARRVAGFLDVLGRRRTLDVGSGPGKFCVVAAAHSPRSSFVGVEQREPLVAVARSLASKLRVENASFELGDATTLSWTEYDSFYVFNSFAENLFDERDRLDDSVELTPRRRVADVLRVERWLATADQGTVLVTYHGLGGPIPEAYECLHTEPAGTGWLHVWRKGAAANRDSYWLEDDEEVRLVSARTVGSMLQLQANTRSCVGTPVKLARDTSF